MIMLIKPYSESQSEFLARQAKKLPPTCFECKSDQYCFAHGLARGHDEFRGHEKCNPVYREDIPLELR